MRRSSLRRGTRKDDELSRDARAMRRMWAPMAQVSECAVCCHGRYLHGHHVIPLSALRFNGVDDRLWWDVRNQLVLCHEPAPNRCHDRHTLYVVRVPRAVVIAHAPRALEFADEVGLRWKFELEYPDGESSRLRSEGPGAGG